MNKKLSTILLLLLLSFGVFSYLNYSNNVNAGCIEDQRRGCCSRHGGVCGCKDGSALCCDGSLSPTCDCN